MIGPIDNWLLALPEIILAGGALSAVVLGVLGAGPVATYGRVNVFIGGLLVAALLALVLRSAPETLAFSGLYTVDAFTTFMKALVLLGTLAAMIIARPYLQTLRLARFEVPLLMLLAALGMCIMVSSNSLLTLYIGLELQSLSLYVLAALDRDSRFSTEAGLKYFVLGAVASGMLLFGSSLIYGFSGTLSFTVLADQLPVLLNGGLPSVGLVFGLVFVLAALAFKISAVPFHMWTPDVYEGAPTAITAFFAGAPKVAAMALFIRVMLDALPALQDQWTQVVYAISLLSMTLGAFAAIAQTSIKRLMAYSSIGHVGYALMGLVVGTQESIAATTFYMSIYMVTTVGAFVCILAMRSRDGMTDRIQDLAGLHKERPLLAGAFAFFMLSMLGFPPFAGFFGKLLVFQTAVDEGLILLAVVGALTSAVAAYYYLRIIKVMYLDEPEVEFVPHGDAGSSAVMFGAALFASPLFLIIWPTLWGSAQNASAALFAS